MPSLFSKIRHRKTGSTSSIGSNASSNAPPSPSTPSRSTLQPTSNSPTTRSSQQTQSQGRTTDPSTLSHPPTARSDPEIGSDVVVIDKSLPTPPSGRDETGHSAPFADESDRPALPTTTSNVNNPVPVPSDRISSTSQDTSYVDTSSGVKPLPAVPEVQTPGGGQGHEQDLSLFPTGGHTGNRPRRLSEVSGGPPVPPRSPIRSSISVDRNDAASPPPLPHVTSTARDHLSPTDRPGMIGSASRPQRPSEELSGEFPRANSIPSKPAGPRDARSTEISTTGIAQGPSSWSLRENAQTAEAYLSQSRRSSNSSYSDNDGDRKAVGGRGAGATGKSATSSRGYEASQIRPASGSHTLRDDLRSNYYNDREPPEHISDHLSRIAQRSHPKAVSTRNQEEYANVSLPPGTHPQLEAQRHSFASQLLSDAETRRESQTRLSRAGEQAFHAAGMGQLLGKQNTVDVHTKWLEPVVKEHIRRTEHTEYMTIINREIHKYHIYPKIQPIYDPNPTRLETRHRIFSPADGKWHEVIGDAAAIEILGEDVFRSGPKEVREERQLALPALDGSDSLSSKMQGLKVFDDGIGRGQGGVFEREYPLGQKAGEWKEISRLGGVSANEQGQGSGSGSSLNNKNRDSVGVAL